jgi:hypothetical protein
MTILQRRPLMAMGRLPLGQEPVLHQQAQEPVLVLPQQVRHLTASGRDQRQVPGAEFQKPARILTSRMNRTPPERNSSVA